MFYGEQGFWALHPMKETVSLPYSKGTNYSWTGNVTPWESYQAY
jgi:hypothetical protein